MNEKGLVLIPIVLLLRGLGVGGALSSKIDFFFFECVAHGQFYDAEKFFEEGEVIVNQRQFFV